MTETMLNQYLTFTVEKEMYALNVANVREVLGYTTVTVVPRMPEYMKGVINLRGSVVPVLDLKRKFGLGDIEQAMDTSVIVTEVRIEDKAVVIGLLCDSVSEVIDFHEDDIEPAPNMGTQIQADFIRGMGKKDDQFIIILEISKILTHQDIQSASAPS
ncbi:MAG: chemotaxis protein CheW [Spirochaetales bacterium]|nr:chemotaxis protein CheW [Spirochaetales bacterium]